MEETQVAESGYEWLYNFVWTVGIPFLLWARSQVLAYMKDIEASFETKLKAIKDSVEKKEQESKAAIKEVADDLDKACTGLRTSIASRDEKVTTLEVTTASDISAVKADRTSDRSYLDNIGARIGEIGEIRARLVTLTELGDVREALGDLKSELRNTKGR